MFYSNVILSKKNVKMENRTAENMVNMAIVEVCNTKQSIKRLQRYQEEIGRLSGSR